MRYLKALLVLFTVGMLSACTTFSTVKPETHEEALVVAEYSYQSALRTIDVMTTAGQFSASEARKIIVAIDTAEASLMAFRMAVATGTENTGMIVAATAATAVLVTIINAKQASINRSSFDPNGGGGDPMIAYHPDERVTL